jgi:tripartite-type tricarboxylate transporter receptor subunit TctC
MEEAVNDPSVRGRFVEQGAEPMSPGPEELAKFMASETAKWRDIILTAGIEPN